MKKTSLITNIKELIGIQPVANEYDAEVQKKLNCLNNAFLVVENLSLIHI